MGLAPLRYADRRHWDQRANGWCEVLVRMLLASVVVPKMLSSFSKADLVHTMNRPTWPPGASCMVHAKVHVSTHSGMTALDSRT